MHVGTDIVIEALLQQIMRLDIGWVAIGTRQREQIQLELVVLVLPTVIIVIVGILVTLRMRDDGLQALAHDVVQHLSDAMLIHQIGGLAKHMGVVLIQKQEALLKMLHESGIQHILGRQAQLNLADLRCLILESLELGYDAHPVIVGIVLHEMGRKDHFADATLLQHLEGMQRFLGGGKTIINTGQQVTMYITSAPEEILRKMVFQKRKHNLGSLFLSVIRIRGVAV